MKPHRIGLSMAAAVAVLAMAGVAEARNPHCAGGIQYVVQSLRDKERGNTEDYQREIGKAVQQLEMCTSEDPNDLEGLGYLGWAYAEVDSARAAGDAFTRAIEGLTAKGDKKKAAWAATNREHYWSLAFNDGIAKINSAQTTYPDFTKKPETPAEETAKSQAAQKYQQAIASLNRARLLNPADGRAMRNLGAAYSFMGDYEQAVKMFQEGLKVAPNDSELVQSLRAVQVNLASGLVERKDYEKAIASLNDLIKTYPKDANLQTGLADAHFKRAQGLEGDARKPEFKAAGDAYAKAAQLKPGDADLTFNAALAYQNAGEPGLAEPLWEQTLKTRPDDPDAMSSYGATLADLRKFDPAISILHRAVLANPKNKILHRQLGAVYTKAGNNAKGTEELMVYLALQNGQPVTDPASEARKAAAGSAQAKTLSQMGPPEEIYRWVADGDTFDSWFYWAKKVAYHFKAGQMVQKSDWGAADAKTADTGGSK